MGWAAKHDNNEMISCLLSGTSPTSPHHQKMINKQSHGGYTPLHVAAINKSQKAFSALMMDFKADRKIRDFSGKTATSYLGTSYKLTWSSRGKPSNNYMKIFCYLSQ